MTTVDLPLLPLGRGADRSSERGVECPGDLPAASDPDLVARARAAKEALGERVFVLGPPLPARRGHRRSPTSPATRSSSPATRRPGRTRSTSSSAACTSWRSRPTSSPRPAQKVVLPDLAAGCSMADMARLAQVEDAWDALVDAGVADDVVPITYMNSSADIKAFCGRHGGAVCTSSNAERGAGVGLRAEGPGHEGAVPARPAPRPQHRRARAGPVPGRLRGLEPPPAGRRAAPRASSATPG